MEYGREGSWPGNEGVLQGIGNGSAASRIREEMNG